MTKEVSIISASGIKNKIELPSMRCEEEVNGCSTISLAIFVTQFRFLLAIAISCCLWQIS